MAVVEERCGAGPGAAYDAIASEYDGVYSSSLDRAEDDFVRHLICGPTPMRVLDIGCGTGLGLRLCADLWSGGLYEGVDPSGGMLMRARRLATDCHTEWRQMTAEQYCSEITIPTRPDLILLLYCSPYINALHDVVRDLAMMGAESCKMVLVCPGPNRFRSGRYGLARVGMDGQPIVSYREEDLEYIAEFASRSKPIARARFGSYSGMLSRKIPLLLPWESKLCAVGVPVRPDFSYAVLEFGK